MYVSHFFVLKTLNMEKLPYDPSSLERELSPYYISATSDDIQEMLAVVGEKDLPSLFRDIPEDISFSHWGEDAREWTMNH